MPRAGSFRFGGGGGGGGSRSSRDSSHQEYVRKAAAGIQPSSGGWWSSGSALRDDEMDDECTFMSRDHRCSYVKEFVESLTRNGKNLNPTVVAFAYKRLRGCPNPPDLKKLAANREDEDSRDKSLRCRVFIEEMNEALSGEKNEVNASRIEFYKQWLDDCPYDTSELHKSRSDSQPTCES